MSWIAVGLTAVSTVSGLVSSHSANKRAAQSRDLENQRLDLIREQRDNFNRLIDGLPQQTQKYLDNIAQSHARISALLNEAKIRGDQMSASAFQAQKDTVEAHFVAESEAIGLNRDEMLGAIDAMSNKILELVDKDEAVKAKLRDEYKQEADSAVDNLSKMAAASEKRIDGILKTGLPEGAAADISRINQGVTDIKRKTQELEAARGKGGAASRTTAVELEGLKAIGETTAQLRAQARGELIQEGQVQGQLQQAAGQRQLALQPTRSEAELRATQPFNQLRLQTQEQAGNRQLTALGNKNVAIRKLTGAEGEASLAREQAFARDRMSLQQGVDAQNLAALEREQNLTGAYTGQQAGQARSMADIMGAQAQNYANMAAKSNAQATQAFSNAAKGVAGFAIGGLNQPIPTSGPQGQALAAPPNQKFDLQNAGKTSLQFMYGIPK